MTTGAVSGQLERIEDLHARVAAERRRPPSYASSSAAVRRLGVAGAETDGIATSRARSAFSCGIDVATIEALASVDGPPARVLSAIALNPPDPTIE